MSHDISHCNGQAVREITTSKGSYTAKADCPLRVRCHRYIAAQDPEKPEIVSWVGTPEFVEGQCPVFWEENQVEPQNQ